MFFCYLPSSNCSHRNTEKRFRICFACHLKNSLIFIIIGSQFYDFFSRIRCPVIITRSISLDRKHQLSWYTCLSIKRKPVPLSLFKFHIVLLQLDLPCRISCIINCKIRSIVFAQAAFLDINFCPRNEKFRTTSCIFHMNSLPFSFQIHMGDKTVWSFYKNSLPYSVIFHIS